MKKLLTMIALIVLAIGTMAAQNSKTITGYVVDKNGNPIIGAEVMAAGGGATTITESDGSFTIEVHPLLKKLTASYAGMEDNTISLEGQTNVVFTMKPEPKLRAFASVVLAGGAGIKRDTWWYGRETNMQFGAGLMGGQLGKWGWYAKAMYNDDVEWLEGGMSITAGAVKQLGKSLKYLYFGIGPAYDGSICVWGAAVDLGLIFKVSKRINVIAGLNYDYLTGSGCYAHIINANIGVGYTF